jgi:hypothetical protein
LAEEEVKRREKKALFALFAVVAVLALLLGYTYYSYYEANQALKSQVATLINQLNALETEERSLREQISSLLSQITSLESIGSLKNSTILEGGKRISISGGGSAEFDYETPYVGYIKITFSASDDIVFWVGSNFTNSFYSRYPQSGASSAGSFIVPVLPGKTMVRIDHPAPVVGASVTFTIEYVY